MIPPALQLHDPRGARTALLAAALAVSCLRPSQERAERDLELGRAETAELSVEVVEGLAIVRALESERLELWSSAPGWKLKLELGPREREFELVVHNAMPGAELTALAPEPLRLPASSSARGTLRRWRWRGAGSVRLELETADARSVDPFRFALLSDVQEALPQVSDVFRRINGEPGVRFVLGAGDLTERGERAELERFQRELELLTVPYYTTLGNHELGQSPSLYPDYFGRANYHFEFKGAHFTLLDSAGATLDPLVYDWLDEWLRTGEDAVHFVAMHIPPIDPIGVRNGSWASRSEAAKLLSRLAQARVDATLYGHIHSYYAFQNAGIPAFISGGGGAIPERFDGVGRHFLIIEVDPSAETFDTRLVRVD